MRCRTGVGGLFSIGSFHADGGDYGDKTICEFIIEDARQETIDSCGDVIHSALSAVATVSGAAWVTITKGLPTDGQVLEFVAASKEASQDPAAATADMAERLASSTCDNFGWLQPIEMAVNNCGVIVEDPEGSDPVEDAPKMVPDPYSAVDDGGDAGTPNVGQECTTTVTFYTSDYTNDQGQTCWDEGQALCTGTRDAGGACTVNSLNDCEPIEGTIRTVCVS